MPKLKKAVLDKQARQMVYNVNLFMEKEAAEGVANVQQSQKRTAAATDTSVATVRRIIKEGRQFDSHLSFKTPGKKRSRGKPKTGVDLGVIKRCIQNFHITERELPTVEKLRKKLQVLVNFQGSERSLRRMICDLGFKWKKIENHRQLLVEKTYVRLRRIEFLEVINKYRQEGRPVIYTDESYIGSSHLVPTAGVDDPSLGLKDATSRGQHVIILHAGSETGFLPNTLFTFRADAKLDGYHNRNFEMYEKWLRTQFIPNLPPNSVVVVDNTSYFHNKEYLPAPSSNAKTVDMQTWLSTKGIYYNEQMLKPQLYKLVKAHRDQYRQIRLDEVLAEHHHTVLRLPPGHQDLNPFVLAWAAIRSYICSKKISWTVKGVKELINDKINQMSIGEWKKMCLKVKEVEDQYKVSDYLVDMLTEEFVVQGDDDHSDIYSDGVSDDEYKRAEGDDDDDDEGSISSASDNDESFAAVMLSMNPLAQ